MTSYSRELAVSLPEAMTVAFVASAGPLTQSQLAERMNAGRAVTGVRIDALESLGWLERLHDPNDRRVWLISITPSGVKAVERILEIDEALRGKVRSGITHAQRRELADILLRLQGNLDQVIDGLAVSS